MLHRYRFLRSHISNLLTKIFKQFVLKNLHFTTYVHDVDQHVEAMYTLVKIFCLQLKNFFLTDLELAILIT